jgi:hypothetical protein
MVRGFTLAWHTLLLLHYANRVAFTLNIPYSVHSFRAGLNFESASISSHAKQAAPRRAVTHARCSGHALSDFSGVERPHVLDCALLAAADAVDTQPC